MRLIQLHLPEEAQQQPDRDHVAAAADVSTWLILEQRLSEVQTGLGGKEIHKKMIFLKLLVTDQSVD